MCKECEHKKQKIEVKNLQKPLEISRFQFNAIRLNGGKCRTSMHRDFVWALDDWQLDDSHSYSCRFRCHRCRRRRRRCRRVSFHLASIAARQCDALERCEVTQIAQFSTFSFVVRRNKRNGSVRICVSVEEWQWRASSDENGFQAHYHVRGGYECWAANGHIGIMPTFTWVCQTPRARSQTNDCQCCGCFWLRWFIDCCGHKHGVCALCAGQTVFHRSTALALPECIAIAFPPEAVWRTSASRESFAFFDSNVVSWVGAPLTSNYDEDINEPHCIFEEVINARRSFASMHLAFVVSLCVRLFHTNSAGTQTSTTLSIRRPTLVVYL